MVIVIADTNHVPFHQEISAFCGPSELDTATWPLINSSETGVDKGSFYLSRQPDFQGTATRVALPAECLKDTDSCHLLSRLGTVSHLKHRNSY